MSFAARPIFERELAADVVAASYSNSGPGGATTSIQFRSNGDVYVSDNVGDSVRYQWKTGGGTGGDYRIRWTINTGSLAAGSDGTWLTLSSNHTFTVLVSGFPAIQSCGATVEIQMSASPNTSLDSANISIQAVSENPE